MPLTDTDKRIYYLDLAKVLTAFMVIFAHFYSGQHPICVYFYAFHVPLFYVVSGIFHRLKGTVQWKKYVSTLLLPAFLFAVLEAVARGIGGIVWGHSINDAVDFVKFFALGLLKGNGTMGIWFLIALFWCKVLTDILLNGRYLILKAFAMAVLFIIPFAKEWHLPFLLSQGLMALPFYIAGFVGKDLFMKLKEHPFCITLFLSAAILLYFTSRYAGKVSMMGVWYGTRPPAISVPLFYLNGILGSIMVFSFCLFPIPHFRQVNKFAKSLITVVGAQGIFFYIVYQTLGFDRQLFVTIPLSFLIFALCYYLHLLISPLLNYSRHSVGA